MKEDRLLIRVGGNLLDVTDFVAKHPGGGEVLRQFSNGQDATDAFNRQGHSAEAVRMMERYVVEKASSPGVIASDHSKLFTDPYNKRSALVHFGYRLLHHT